MHMTSKVIEDKEIISDYSGKLAKYQKYNER